MASKYPNYYQKAINATFRANVDKLQQLIDEGHFNQRLLTDIGMMSRPFPIWRISQCWNKIASMTGWREDVQEAVEDFRKRNEAIMKIYQEQFGVEFTPIDFQRYHDDFYCDDPDETIDTQLVIDSVQELLDAGVRQIDIDLYSAGAKFYYEEVKKLLIAGANPAAWLPDPFPSGFQLDDRIGAECSFLDTEVAYFLYDKTITRAVDRQDICHLLGWAAYETMYDLIEEYRQFPHYTYEE